MLGFISGHSANEKRFFIGKCNEQLSFQQQKLPEACTSVPSNPAPHLTQTRPSPEPA
ncbi:hypothetical protein FOC4_g10007371 [Fusarium odoratissimum]|uniref:Uncharacterized protein n=2 Tax=Fusarium oxysporum species complex TaxID=171631 RepID=N1RR44_FUSC4|nr:hypothetical protein FOC4_g10007371 [Fusarium odoratissimum]TXC05314.1 hypothetical protein FocTR4_00001994 [Fusarium oxysporum f. sp. cubense]